MQYSPEILTHAIIIQAANDYRSALKRNKTAEIRYFEKWFLSDWGQALSVGCGEFIIYKIKSEVGVINKTRIRAAESKVLNIS